MHKGCHTGPLGSMLTLFQTISVCTSFSLLVHALRERVLSFRVCIISLNIDCHLGKVSETPAAATFIIPTICLIVFDSAPILIVVLYPERPSLKLNIFSKTG